MNGIPKFRIHSSKSGESRELNANDTLDLLVRATFREQIGERCPLCLPRKRR